MSGMSEIIFHRDADSNALVPTFTSGHRCRRILVRNFDAFELNIADGMRFAVNVVQVKGAGSSAEVTVEIERVVVRITGKSKLGKHFWIDPEILAMILADIENGHHILLTGPKGSGKTTLAKILAEELGVPFIKVDGTGINKPKDPFGSESAKDGSTTWKQSDLSIFLETHATRPGWPKGIVLFDEFNRMGHNMSSFHSLFDDTRSFDFTTSEGTVHVCLPDGIIVIMAVNPAGNGYFGNMDLDVAMDDRVEPYYIDYPPTDWEIGWLVEQTRILQTEATRLVSIANEIRRVAKAQHMTKGGPSPRRTLRAARTLRCGLPFDVVVRHKFINRYDGEAGEVNSERSTVVEALRAGGLLGEPSSGVITTLREAVSHG